MPTRNSLVTRIRGATAATATPPPATGTAAGLAPHATGSGPVAHSVVSRIRGAAFTSTAAHGKVSRIRGAVSAPGGVQSHGTVSRVRGTTIQAVTAALTAPANVEPFATVVLDASGSTGSPTGYIFTQLTGPTVTLTGTGSMRSFTAPGLSAGAAMSFRVTVSFPGAPDATADVPVTAYPVIEYDLVGASWVPHWETQL